MSASSDTVIQILDRDRQATYVAPAIVLVRQLYELVINRRTDMSLYGLLFIVYELLTLKEALERGEEDDPSRLFTKEMALLAGRLSYHGDDTSLPEPARAELNRACDALLRAAQIVERRIAWDDQCFWSTFR